LAAAPGAAAALDLVIGYFVGLLEASRFTKGCPVATVALEQAATSDPLQHVCASAYSRWQQLIAGQLARDGVSTERADALAGFSLAAIEGALLLCRAHRSVEPLRRAGEELQRLLSPGERG
jgi:TetR/AcrR family transcriptional repressor of lmrAB and yxaGH operons